MTLLWSAGGWLNILSGALMAVLGLFLLVANPRKDWNRLFSLFATLWGLQIMAANVIRVTDDAQVALVTSEIGLPLLLPLYFFLVAFAAGFPRPEGAFAKPGALPLLALPAVAAVVVLFARPEWLLQRVAPSPEGGFTAVWGPAFPYLAAAPLYAATLYALFLMSRRLREAGSPVERTQVSFVLAAFGMFVAYNIPVLLFLFGGAALGIRPAPMAERAVAITLAAIMLAGLALLAVLTTRLARVARESGIEGERRAARMVLLALLGGAAPALAIIALQVVGGPRLDAVGIIRVAAVALIAYAIARFQLFDIDLRVKSAATTTSAALVGIAVAAVAWLLLRNADLSLGLGIPIVAVVALGAFLPMLGAAARVADRLAPSVSREGEHLYLRKLDVYRASVEQWLREGGGVASDDAWLAQMRARLGLTERDHTVVVSLAMAGAEAQRRAPALQAGALVFGRYQVERALAEGAHGRVLLARDRARERLVVIKELQARWRADSAAVETFLREARIAGSMRHANIVGVIDIERHGEDRYIVMEHMDAGSLQERVARGALPVEEALRIARATLAGLGAAHAKGIVHRDVKPANILLGSGGEVKLADFGIAQLAEDDPQRTISGLTTGGFQPGTLQYMSPEQARGATVDARSDLYAVGGVLHRMLTGRPHVEIAGLDEFAARAKIAGIREPPGLDPRVPAALHAVIARALAPAAEARFESAEDMARALASTVEPAQPTG